MSLTLDIGWLVATLLVSARVAGALILAPVLGPAQIPASARVVLVLAFSSVLATLVPARSALLGLPELAVAMGGEMLLGATFSFGFIMAYGATQVAGRLLDVQMGFGVASVLSPTTQAPSPVVGSMFGMAFVAVFLALDGHHVLLQALSVSVRTIAPGQVVESIAWSGLLEHSSIVFVFGLALAAPVMFALLLADLALAVFARSMPQLNVFILSFALKIVLGLCGLALSIRVAERVLASLTGSVFGFWGRLANG